MPDSPVSAAWILQRAYQVLEGCAFQEVHLIIQRERFAFLDVSQGSAVSSLSLPGTPGAPLLSHIFLIHPASPSQF